MNDFSYQCRTNLIFGEGQIEKIDNLIPIDAKVMIIYGGGSIKKNGVYQRVITALHQHNVIEFSGIEPNPHYETCLKASELAKKESVTFILAVGGGSVMDASKFIALAACYHGTNAWDAIINGCEVVSHAIELAMISTLPATGSEMNNGFVITNVATKEKRAGSYSAVMPLFSILEPSTTLSLDQRQTSNGIADSFIHVTEQYLNQQSNCPLQDRWSEGILTTLIEVAPKLMLNLKDLEARRTMMHAATMALNHMATMGVTADWATHQIGHELTAYYGLDHGQTLTIVWPSLMRVRKNEKKDKLLVYGRNVFGIKHGSDDEKIEATIKATEDFFRSIKMPVCLSDLSIPAQSVEIISDNFENRTAGEDGKVDRSMVKAILMMAL